MIVPHAWVTTSAVVLCLVFSALLLQAIRRQRQVAAELAWFYDSGTFNLPKSFSQRSALRDFGSLFMRRAFPSARRSTPSSQAEGRRHEVARPAGGVARFNRSSGAAARECAANQSANGETVI